MEKIEEEPLAASQSQQSETAQEYIHPPHARTPRR